MEEGSNLSRQSASWVILVNFEADSPAGKSDFTKIGIIISRDKVTAIASFFGHCSIFTTTIDY